MNAWLSAKRKRSRLIPQPPKWNGGSPLHSILTGSILTFLTNVSRLVVNILLAIPAVMFGVHFEISPPTRTTHYGNIIKIELRFPPALKAF